MNSQILDIDLWQLLMALSFVLISGGASLLYRLRLEKDLLIGTVRTFLQLFLMGYALTIIFELQNFWLVICVFIVMIFFAAWIIRGRVAEPDIPFFIPTLIAMLISYMSVTALVSGIVVGAEPWWRPRYFIPLGGMVVGNSMNAIAITLERLFSELRNRQDEIEMMLCLGADYREASQDMVRNAMRAGMIPSLNSMMGVGIVFIPGMMTGQILSGADPLIAIRYQIVVMLMLVGSTALGSLLVAIWARRLSFSAAHQLLLRISTAKRTA
jgi:putative ABC transport system permease protein